MSVAWARGSERGWRRVREEVLARDGYRCRAGDPVHRLGRAMARSPGCTGSDPSRLQVHHFRGRQVTGDDPAWCVACCRSCNLLAGDPAAAPDPEPAPRTAW